MKRNLTIIILVLIAAAALTIRIVSAARCEARPELSDMGVYNDAAMGIEVPEPLPPGYPLFLRSIYSLFGPRNYKAVFIVQGLLSAFTVLVLYWVTLKIGGTSAALVAAGIAAVYPNFIVYNLTTLTETIGVLFVSLLIAVLVSRIDERWKSILAAAAIFAGYLFKPVMLLFCPGVFLGVRKRFLFAAAVAALFVPYLAFGSSDKGYHRAARAFFKTYHPQSDGKRDVDVWKTDLGDRNTPTRAYLKRGWSYVTEDPWKISETIYNKATIVFSRGWESFVMRPLVPAGRASRAVMMYGYIPVMLFGFAGLARLIDRRNRILALAAASYLILIILVAIFKTRYRLLIEPILIVYAALMIVHIARALRSASESDRASERCGLVDRLKADRDILAVILVLALALRIYAAITQGAPPTSREALAFDGVALGGRIDDTISPLYSIFLRLVYAVFGARNYLAVYILQALAGSAAVLLIYCVASCLHSRWAGVIAAGLAAVYPGFISLGLTTLPLAFSLLLAASIMALAVSGLREHLRSALAGLLVGIGILLDPALVCLAPGALFTVKRRGLFLLVLVLSLAPVSAINEVRLGRAQPVYRIKAYNLGLKNFKVLHWSRTLDRLYNNASVLMKRPMEGDDAADSDNRAGAMTAAYSFALIMLSGLAGLARHYSRFHRHAMLPVLWYVLLLILFSKVTFSNRVPFEAVLIVYAAVLVADWKWTRIGGEPAPQAPRPPAPAER